LGHRADRVVLILNAATRKVVNKANRQWATKRRSGALVVPRNCENYVDIVARQSGPRRRCNTKHRFWLDLLGFALAIGFGVCGDPDISGRFPSVKQVGRPERSRYSDLNIHWRSASLK